MKIAKILLGFMFSFMLSVGVTISVAASNPDANPTTLGCVMLGTFLASASVSLIVERQTGVLNAACGLITANIGADCSTPPSPGTNETLYIYNFDEVTGYTTNADTITIEAITMGGSSTGFKHVGQNASLEPKYNTVNKKYVTQWNHELKYRIFYWDSLTKLQIEKMLQGKFICVVENNEKGTGTLAGKMAYEAYGTGAGLYCTEVSREPNSSEEAGAFVVTLKSKEGLEEGRMPRPVYITSYAATKAMIDATL